ERLAKEGHEVTVLDNLSLGRLENILDLGVRFIQKDVKDELPPGFEAIFHEGMPSSRGMYEENPNLVADVVEGIISILEYAKWQGSKVILASSSSIYNGNPIPWREDMPIIVTDWYTEARFYCERLCELYHKLFGVRCTILRYFSVFGDKEEHKGRYANVITQMKWAKEEGRAFKIYGDGSQSRDLIHVSDVVKANLRALDYNSGFEIFNVGRGKAYSFNDMAKMVGVKVEYVPNPIPNYVETTLADTRKAEEKLGFSAKINPEEIVLGEIF
ncbi:MAG: NAD-dependent epimerase/dehydratase family protein, partial [Thermodesulfovibrionales bacterium]|nr:NAD-dependent epimerase/dehydratase family protein [Thermodesulfovibrionales bacterium]